MFGAKYRTTPSALIVHEVTSAADDALHPVRLAHLRVLDEYSAADFVRHSHATPEAPDIPILREFKDFLQRDLATFPAPEHTVV